MHDTDIIKAMEAHAARFNLALTTIGQLSVQNRHAYERIKKGTAHQSTVRVVREWLEQDEAARTISNAQGRTQ